MGLFNIKDNSRLIQQAKDEAVQRALEEIGIKAESYAKLKCPVDTGRLRNSITHNATMQEDTVYIGTNVEYAPYVEFGTGIHAKSGGRQTPWVYKDQHGNWHKTRGSRPHPFLKPAIEEHLGLYQKILENNLKH